jgi:hypothetical protein
VSGLPDTPAYAADQDSALDVRDALLAVPPRQRATLVLRFYCDLDVEQAAVALGCSAGTSWQYAPGAWAVLGWGAGMPAVPGASEEAVVMHVATTVRYGGSTPLEFPYRMPKPSARWAFYQIEFTERSGRNLALVTNWTERSARAGGPMLQVVVMPEIPGDTCPAVNATERQVTLDGTSAVLEDLGGRPGSPDVCAADVKGWTVGVGVLGPGKPTLSLSTVMDYARALRLHTADPAGWTTDPFR